MHHSNRSTPSACARSPHNTHSDVLTWIVIVGLPVVAIVLFVSFLAVCCGLFAKKLDDLRRRLFGHDATACEGAGGGDGTGQLAAARAASTDEEAGIQQLAAARATPSANATAEAAEVVTPAQLLVTRAAIGVQADAAAIDGRAYCVCDSESSNADNSTEAEIIPAVPVARTAVVDVKAASGSKATPNADAFTESAEIVPASPVARAVMYVKAGGASSATRNAGVSTEPEVTPAAPVQRQAAVCDVQADGDYATPNASTEAEVAIDVVEDDDVANATQLLNADASTEAEVTPAAPPIAQAAVDVQAADSTIMSTPGAAEAAAMNSPGGGQTPRRFSVSWSVQSHASFSYL